MSRTFSKADADDSRAEIRKALLSCTRTASGAAIIYTVLRSVSRSGMMRKITPFVVVNGKPVSLAWHYDRSHQCMADDSAGRWSNRISGVGMDMGFHLADSLAWIGGEDGKQVAFSHEWL